MQIDQLEDIEGRVIAALDEAVENAVRSADALALPRPARTYILEGALRQLFARLCGADPQSMQGGDPEIAWKILYVGRAAARHWERARNDSPASRRKRERREDLDKDAREERRLGQSARDLAVETVIRTLVDHQRALDPSFDARLEATMTARLARLEPASSDQDRAFIAKARAFLALLTRPRGGAEPPKAQTDRESQK